MNTLWCMELLNYEWMYQISCNRYMRLKMQDAMSDAKRYFMRATKLKLATLFGAWLLSGFCSDQRTRFTQAS